MEPRFPAIFDCGHNALDMCNCASKARNATSTRISRIDGDSPIDRVLRDFCGSWRPTLEGYGCHIPSGRRHGPCPICGGKDRFRFDDKDGRGTWFCSHCDPQSGGGLALLAKFIGKSAHETALELLGEVGRSLAPERKFKPRDSADEEAKAAAEAAAYAKRLVGGAVMAGHPYMSAKGLDGEWMTNGEPIAAAGGVIIKPGELLLVPAYRDGVLLNIQQITTEKKKFVFGGEMAGLHHDIAGRSDKWIAIVEGYATGVTVNRATGWQTICAFSTGNLASVSAWAAKEYPHAKIVFFADNDPVDDLRGWRPGWHYANQAAAPLGALVALPPELGDWDDYRQRHGIDATKEAMRQALRGGCWWVDSE